MNRTLYVRRASFAAVLVIAAACASEVAAPIPRLELPPAGANRDAAPLARGVPGHAGDAAANRATPVSCTPRRVASWSGKFGPAGGVLMFGESSLIIPGGALRDTVTISVTQLGDGTSTVDFEPEGLHFYKPVGLVLDGSGCSFPSGRPASVVYLDDAGVVRETIPAYYDPHWKAIAAPIVHFSGYAIAF